MESPPPSPHDPPGPIEGQSAATDAEPSRTTRRGVLRAAAAAASVASTVSFAGCSSPTQSSDDVESTDVSTDVSADVSAQNPTSTSAYETSVSHDVTEWSDYDPTWSSATTMPPRARVETVVKNLEIPWDLAFAPNGDLFVTERVGRVSRFTSGELRTVARPPDAIDAGSTAPGSDERSWFLDGGEGGTMGIATHPQYPSVPLVYVYYTAQTDGDSENRLVRMDVTADDPATNAQTLLTTPANLYHNGGRIAFGPANYLWVTVGDAGDDAGAQDPARLVGSVLRLTPDGEAAPDNPALADPRVFTYGHRNPQGISWLPDGRAVVTEHGPGPDEVNVLVPGGNYGWPEARTPSTYEGSDFVRPAASSHGDQVWAPSGCTFVTTGPWRGRLLVGTLGMQRVTSFTITRTADDGADAADPALPPVGDGVRYDADWLNDEFVLTRHDLSDALGRVRHVARGPDGMYAITSNRDGRAPGPYPTENDDRLVRLAPVDDSSETSTPRASVTTANRWA